MVTRFFISVLLLISVSCFISFCSSNYSEPNILLDISEQIKESRGKNNAAIQSIMKSITYIGNNQPVTLYYEHFFQKGTYDFNKTINQIKQLKSGFKLLVNVKEHATIDNVNDITRYVRGRYSDILRIAAETTFLSGVSFEFIDTGNICPVNSPATNTTLIQEVQQLLQSFAARNLKIGYKLYFTQLKCRQYSLYIKNSNYLIINIPFKRNDKEFVESFDVFKNNLKTISTRAKSFVDSLFGGNYTGPVYYKLTLHTNLNVENVENIRCIQGVATSHAQKIIKLASEKIINVQEEYMSRYETLLVQYCRQLGVDGQDATFILKFPPENSDTPQALVIPQMPTLPVMGLGTSGMRSISFLLEEIASSGFNTVMINGDIWQEMIKKGISKSNCYNAQCRPENVWYLNDKEYAFSNYDKNNITTLLEVDGMYLRALVVSRYYAENYKFNWKTVIDSLKIEAGCTELTDIFGEILNNGTFGIICNSLEVRKTKGCGSLGFSSNKIVWRGKLIFNVYSVHDFVESTMKKLDALVLGRQILKNMRKNEQRNENVEIILRIKVEYKGKGRTVIGNHMYCTDLSIIIYQFYEILLTWAKIHDFTIILEPISDDFGYDNPISWKKLEISSTGHMRNLMHSFPIFIRRSYNVSRVFGSWTSGMYSCIQQTIDLESVKEINFIHPSTGSTIYFDLRADNTSINTEELQVMLLFAFGKFSTVELIISSQSDLQILYDTVLQTDFEQNLKANNISEKNVYIDISINLSVQLIKSITEIGKILEKNGIQVQTHHPNAGIANLFGFTSGKFINNCTATANALLTSHFEEFEKIRYAKYIVCDTSPINAQNGDKNSMRDYLDSHLYLQKVFKYLFRNITGVYFRLHPLLVGNTFEEQSRNLLLFLTDIYKYATSYDIHYFLLPVLPQETERNMAGFWTIRNYANLLDINSFTERQANLLGQTNWKPKLVNQPEIDKSISSTSSPTVKSSKSTTMSSLNSSVFTTDMSNSSPKSTSEKDNNTMLPTQHKSNQESKQANFLSSNYLYIVIGAFLIVILVLLTVGVKTFRNRRYLTTKDVSDFIQGRRETLEEAVVKRKRQTSRNFNVFDGLLYQKDYEISTENIKVDKKPGSIIFKGKFSKVFLGKLEESTNDVLVEICNKRIPKAYFMAMLSEVKMLCYIGKHENIVDFIGSYTEEIQQGVLWIVKEFCQKGSLYEYLQLVKDDIRSQTLIRFAKEISAGMDYLSCQDVVHGDLRTKNVFLDQLNKTCKIGNFGATRKLLEYKILSKKGKFNLLPWRWMAFETLQNLDLSIHSDIWSYGVTIWEILSTGNLPYGEDVVEKATFVKMLKEGTRLECPNRASPAIYQIMTQCWALDPNHRPDFEKLANFFSDLLSNLKDDSTL